MNIFNLIVEIITSPFSFLMRTNIGVNTSKVNKSWIIFLIALAIVIILVLFVYRQQIFVSK